MTTARKTLLIALPLAAVAALLGPVSASAGNNNTVSFGGNANLVGVVGRVEYEHMIKDRFSVGARVGVLNYTYKDGSYEEDGTGNGVEFIARYYPRAQGFQGFYVGGGIGYWRTNWDYTDPEDTPSRDEGTTSAINANVTVGWKIPLGSGKVYIDPSITVGNFFGISTDSDFDQEPELGLYAGGGVSVGFVF